MGIAKKEDCGMRPSVPTTNVQGPKIGGKTGKGAGKPGEWRGTTPPKRKPSKEKEEY